MTGEVPHPQITAIECSVVPTGVRGCVQCALPISGTPTVQLGTTVSLLRYPPCPRCTVPNLVIVTLKVVSKQEDY